MAANTIEFKRGDGITHLFAIPATSWVPGGKLFFAAKPAPDDDTTEAAALINQSFTDSNVTDVSLTVNGVTSAYKQYTCYFPPSATSSIISGGKRQITLQGEFEWVAPNGVPSTFPGSSNYIPTIIYTDIRRSVT